MVAILGELLQLYAEGRDYFTLENFYDSLAFIFAIVCQYYYWNLGENDTGYFIPATDCNFEVFVLPMFLLLNFTMIF